MTRLEWGAQGKRFYEVGIDRGVLYVNGVGVPWNGLVSVEKEFSGGEAKPLYLDGVKYSNRAEAEEFGATLTAFTYPDEFAECDGSKRIGSGLYATNQRRKSFDLCYRTLVGNDVEGDSHAYKLHLIYSALAAPSTASQATIADDVEAVNFSWQLTAKPPINNRIRPTSYFVIDSREVPDDLLSEIEAVLYGDADNPPRMPTAGELINRFESDALNAIDAGNVSEPYYVTVDGGHIPVAQTSTVDGGEL